MKRTILFCNIFLACSLIASATTTLTTGTPGDALLATPTAPSPSFGTLINFDSLVPNSSLAAGRFAAQGISSISSPDGLQVVPYSTQSFPNEIFDNSSNGTANITIKLGYGVNEIGIGIADSDPVTVYLQALATNGTALGSAFSVTIPENTINPGNGYYVISDTTYDIGGLKVFQPTASSSFSGLAVDDLQLGAAAPEPAVLSLAGVGLLAIALLRQRRRSE